MPGKDHRFKNWSQKFFEDTNTQRVVEICKSFKASNKNESRVYLSGLIQAGHEVLLNRPVASYRICFWIYLVVYSEVFFSVTLQADDLD